MSGITKRSKNSEPSGQTVKTMKAPSPIVIIVCIILISAIASYIIPAGVFDRIVDPNTGKTVVDPTSFHYTEQSPTTLMELFESVTLGIQGLSLIHISEPTRP